MSVSVPAELITNTEPFKVSYCGYTTDMSADKAAVLSTEPEEWCLRTLRSETSSEEEEDVGVRQRTEGGGGRRRRSKAFGSGLPCEVTRGLAQGQGAGRGERHSIPWWDFAKRITRISRGLREIESTRGHGLEVPPSHYSGYESSQCEINAETGGRRLQANDGRLRLERIASAGLPVASADVKAKRQVSASPRPYAIRPSLPPLSVPVPGPINAIAVLPTD
ncbi:unnamed protein product [Heligmosomoides polygyrus]|uniref:Uncharacterized protein n=1 Tax=Heligmosomoides polygyrus TaxID=6339 RepID=A0A183F3B8_HELPZ|nr:unnamed protein product [Heligmosomoides polygyrus]